MHDVSLSISLESVQMNNALGASLPKAGMLVEIIVECLHGRVIVKVINFIKQNRVKIACLHQIYIFLMVFLKKSNTINFSFLSIPH